MTANLLPIGQRVVVVQSLYHVGQRGTVADILPQAWHYPYLVKLDCGLTIWTNQLGVQPID